MAFAGNRSIPLLSLLVVTFLLISCSISTPSSVLQHTHDKLTRNEGDFLTFQTGKIDLTTTRFTFSDLAQTPQYNELSLLLVQVDSQYTHKWSKVLNPFIVEYIPDSFFILHVIPQQLHHFIQKANAGSTIISTSFFPFNLKLSDDLQRYLKHELEKTSSPIISEDIEQNQQSPTSSSITFETFLQQTRTLLDDKHEQFTTLIMAKSAHRGLEQDYTTGSDPYLQSTISQLFTNPSLLSESNPHRQFHIDQALSKLLDQQINRDTEAMEGLYTDSPNFDHFSQHTQGIQYTNTKTIIASVSALVPQHLQTQEGYVGTFATLSQLFHKSTTELYTHISSQFSAIFSKSVQDSLQQNTLPTIDLISALFPVNKKWSNEALSHKPALISNLSTFLATLAANKLTAADFYQQYAMVIGRTAESESNLSSSSKPVDPVSLLPFHISIASTSLAHFSHYHKHNSAMLTEEQKGQIGRNTMKIQLQTPLYITNQQSLRNLTQDRLALFHGMVQQLYHTSFAEISSCLNLKPSDVGQIDAKIERAVCEDKMDQKLYAETLESLSNTLKSHHAALSSHYSTYVFNLSNNQPGNHAGSTKVGNEAFTAQFQQYLSDLSTLPTLQHISLQRHIDNVLFAVAFTEIQRQMDNIATFQTQQPSTTLPFTPFLSLPSLTTLTSHFLTFQRTVLNHLHAEIADVLSNSPHIHFLDLSSQIQPENNVVRNALHYHLDNIPLREQKPAQMTRFGPYFEAGIDGSNLVMAVSDTGLDSGSCFFRDDTNLTPYTGVVGKETESTGHRKIKSYLVFGDDKEFGANGHGTHCSGTIVGSCIDTTVDVRLTSYNGHLPNAQIAFFDLSNGSKMLSLDNDLVIFEHARHNGAIISSNSWASSRNAMQHIAAQNTYNYRCALYDSWLNDNQDFLILFPSSNYGETGMGTLSVQANAKNPLVVGATQASKTGAVKFFNAFEQTESFTNNPSTFLPLSNLAYFSSTGPTRDGRISPQVTAPGTFIFSASSTAANGKSCNHAAQTGTSMATPSVAGLLGMVQQMLEEGRINQGQKNGHKAMKRGDITGILMKSLITASTVPLTYQSVFDAATPTPLWAQDADRDDYVWDNKRWKYHNLGTFTSTLTTFLVSEPKFISIVPSARIEADATNPRPRLITMNVFSVCPANVVTVSVFQDKDGQGMAQTDQHEFPFLAFKDQRTPFRFKTVPIGTRAQRTLIQITSSIDCVASEGLNNYPLLYSIAEYPEDTVEASTNFLEADCTTLATRLPRYISSFSSDDRVVVSCPPSPACTDHYLEQTTGTVPSNVSGSRYFAMSSSICRAAHHQGAVNVTNWSLTGQDAELEVRNGKKQFVAVTIQQPNVWDNPGGVWYDIKSRNYVTPQGMLENAFTLNWAGELITKPVANKHLYLRTLSPQLNPSSGYGMPMLSAILPLTQYAIYTEDTRFTGVQRQTQILSYGSPSNYIPHHRSHSHCFMVSDQPLIDIYQYSYEEPDPVAPSSQITTHSQIWTSGIDALRVSLSYFDLPGPLQTPEVGRKLVNDLDLFLFTPEGNEQRGNRRADRLNNVEMVDLQPHTFTPGMYCAVVHGVNVPMGYQRYALVANGRGVEKCQENPLPMIVQREHVKETSSTFRVKRHDTVSGLWERRETKCTGESADQTAREDDITTSPFHIDGSTVQIRQGGDCFAMHIPTYSETPQPYYPKDDDKPEDYTPHFNLQRLSSFEFEKIPDQWQMDQSSGKAATFSNTSFVFSGKVNATGALVGWSSRRIPSPTQTTEQTNLLNRQAHLAALREEVIEMLNGSGAKVEPEMLQQGGILHQDQNTLIDGNLLYKFNAQYDMSDQTIIMTVTNAPQNSPSAQTCTYSYHRKVKYPDVQFNTTQVNAVITDPFNRAFAVAISSSVSITLILLAIFAF